MEGKTFSTSEVVLAYSEWAGEGPPVVALHGISGRRAAFLTGWEDGHHSFAYDARGHGDSGRVTGGYTFVSYGEDAVAFLRGVVQTPAVLVGHSLGGMAAIYAAAHAPELVKAALLIDPPLYAPEGPLRDEREPFMATEKQAGTTIADLLATGMTPYRAEAISLLDPAVMSMVLDQRAFDGWDTDAYLRQIRSPVVLEHGDRDQGSVIYPGELQRAAALIESVRLLHMPGTGHVPWAVDADRFNTELSSFFAEHTRG